jgi:MFS family permease
MGGVECSAIAFGPFISGVIAHYSTWRISFYIIVPAAVAIVVLVHFGVAHLRQTENTHLRTKDRLKRIDWIGFTINIPMTLCFILALQWARTVYPWTDWRILFLFALAAVLFASFLYIEYRTGDDSMVPLKMLRQRSVASASLITFCNFAHLAILSYYVSRPDIVRSKTMLLTSSTASFLLSSRSRCEYIHIRPDVPSFGSGHSCHGTRWRPIDGFHWIL